MGIFKDCGCGCNGQKQQQKFMASLLGALIFFVLASPEAFRAVRGIAGKWVATPNGSPSSAGLLLHSIVFLLIVWWTMNIRRELMEAEEAPEEDMEMEEEVEQPAEAAEEEVEEDADLGDGEAAVADMLEAESVEVVTEEEGLLDADAGPEEPEGSTMNESDLIMSDPEGEIIDSCTLSSGKKLVIRN
jgi:hypothetical protein